MNDEMREINHENYVEANKQRKRAEDAEAERDALKGALLASVKFNGKHKELVAAIESWLFAAPELRADKEDRIEEAYNNLKPQEGGKG